MNSEIYLLNKRINALESEIRNLKTAHFKTATTINTMTATANITFSLYLDQLTGEIYGDKRAIITLVTEDNTEMVSACYVNGLDPTMTQNNRFMEVQRINSANGQIKYEVLITSQNADDFATLMGGGSVVLDYTLTLVGSSKFTASVDYRNILGGSS